MFLKSLELNGFKSFAKKVVLEFPAGITAIVGPNGSGKSNLIDAIRWLLGEREAKNLRSAKAEDLIFNGTPKRPRLSLAQAAINFDNHSGFFPIEFNEVVVKRQVGRDGVSQYFLNKSEIKLKEAIDFFARSRLGTKGLIIINQGSSDLFVRVSPEERRVMIEEILGLREYQIKKHEAERKLGSTFLNLDKVKAMIEEVKPRLRTLKRQTGKWEKRTEVENELKILEDIFFSYKLSEIENHRRQIEPKIHEFDKQIKTKQEELAILNNELKQVELKPQQHQELKNIKERQNELSHKRYQIQKDLSRLEIKLEMLIELQPEAEDKSVDFVLNKTEFIKAIDLIKETKKLLEQTLNLADLEQLKSLIKDIASQLNAFLTLRENTKKPISKDHSTDEEKIKLQRQKEELLASINNIENELKQLRENELSITSGLEKFNEQFRASFEKVEKKKEEIAKLEKQKNELIFETEKLNLKLSDLEHQLHQIGRNAKEFSLTRTDTDKKQQRLEEIERQMFKLRAYLASIGEIDESLIKESQEVEKHYNFLTNQSEDLEKAAADLKNLIQELSVKIASEFNGALHAINEEFNKFFRLMFNGGRIKLKVQSVKFKVKNETEGEDEEGGDKKENVVVEEQDRPAGVEIELSLPKKKITSLETLSGGERSLVSIAALFALISVSPPPFLVLDEIDAALDENNSKRFADLIKAFAKKTQFIIVTHNRATMEAADVLYGVTAGEDGTSKILSLKLESAMA